MSHIVVVGTGGTIASRSMESRAGKIADQKAAALIESVGVERLPQGVTVVAHDAGTMNSYNLTLADARQIAAEIRQVLADDRVDGVVVTHGTDTLEETSFLYDLTSGDPRPVVFTGAQQAADAKGGGDGPDNIAAAITVAAHPSSLGRGALVAFAGEIFAVRGVRKVNTFAAQPYASVLGGPIGLVRGDLVHYCASPEPWRRLNPPDRGFDELRIATVLNQPGLVGGDGDIESALLRGTAGFVVLGVGAGNTSKPLVAGIEAATAYGIPVVLSTRLPFGHITPTYGAGGAVDAVAAGAIPVWSLPFTQARLLLAVLINQVGPREARRYLTTFDQRTDYWQPS